MKIAIYGAGAVGCYYGGRLAEAGVDVGFIARENAVAALRAQGLTITTNDAETSVAVRAESDPAGIGPVDAVLVTVKLYDLESVSKHLPPLLHDETIVVSLQNGVDGMDRLDARHRLAAIVYGGVELESPGHVRRLGTLAKLLVGGREDTTRERAEALVELFQKCGIDADIEGNIDKALWTKMVLFATMSAACCLTRLPNGPVLKSPGAIRAVTTGMREVEVLARAKGIELDEDVVKRAVWVAKSMDPSSRPSMLRDLEAGRPLELEGLSGLVSRLGSELDVPTPFHSLAWALLEPHARGRAKS